MIKWFKKRLFKLAKNFLNKNAPPGEFIAYINKDEEKLLKDNGGSGEQWKDTGIKSFFFKKFFKKIIKGIVDIVKAIVNVVVDAVSFLTGGMFDMPDMGNMNNAQQEAQNVLLNKTGSLSNIPVIYGTRKVGGFNVFMTTKGGRNENLYICLALSEGEIAGIDDIFIDGVLSTDTRYNGLISVNKVTGTLTQGANALLLEAPGWSATHRLRGVSYLACKFTMPHATTQAQQDSNPWAGLPQIQALVRGKKVKSSAGLTNSHSTTYENETSLAYSSNPADIILDYLRNPIYGAALTNDRIDFPSFSVARARYATYVTYQDGTTGPLHEINAVIDTAATTMDNIKKLLNHCRSGMPYVQGRFKLKLQDTGNETNPQNPLPTPAFAITTDQLMDGLEIVDGGVRDQANQVRVSYIDPSNNDWTPLECIYPTPGSARDATMLAEDDGVRITKDITLDYCTNRNIAGYLAQMICENERGRKTLGIVTTSELHDVEVGDVVTLTYPRLGINGLFYKVVSHDILTNYTVALGLVEHNAQDYVFNNDNVTLGNSRQRQYVGNRPSYNYRYNGDDGTWGIEPVTPDPNQPSIPDDNPTQPTAAEYNISSITTTSKLDRPNIQLETVQIDMVIPTWLVDSATQINVQKLVFRNGKYQIHVFLPPNYVDLLTLNPAVAQISDNGAGVGTYRAVINVDITNGSTFYRISATVNGGTINSAGFDFTGSTSKFLPPSLGFFS